MMGEKVCTIIFQIVFYWVDSLPGSVFLFFDSMRGAIMIRCLPMSFFCILLFVATSLEKIGDEYCYSPYWLFIRNDNVYSSLFFYVCLYVVPVLECPVCFSIGLFILFLTANCYWGFWCFVECFFKKKKNFVWV